MPYLYTKPINLWNVTKINFCYYNYLHCYATFEINVAGNRFPSINQYTERPQEKHLKRFIERNLQVIVWEVVRIRVKKLWEKRGRLGDGKRFLYGRRLILASISTFLILLIVFYQCFLGRKIWKPGSWRPRWDTIKEKEKHEVKWRFAWCNCITWRMKTGK